LVFFVVLNFVELVTHYFTDPTQLFSDIRAQFRSNSSMLDRHHAWRSLDPTLGISSPFVKKRKKSILIAVLSFSPFSFHLLCCISSNVARVPQGSPRFPKVPQGSPRFPKVPQGSPRFPKVPKGSQRLPKSVHYFLLFFPF